MMKYFTRLPFLILMFVVLTSPLHASSDPLEKVGRDLGKSLRHLNKPRVCLLAFANPDGRISVGSKVVCERLTTYMSTMKHFQIIERLLMEKLLEEQHIENTGIIDPNTVKKIGKVLGVDVIITGTLIELENNKIEINARALTSDTGAVLSASRAVINKEWKETARKSTGAATSAPEPEAEEDSRFKEKPIEIGYPAPHPVPPRWRR